MTADELMGLVDEYRDACQEYVDTDCAGKEEKSIADAAHAALATALRASIAGPEVEAVVEAARTLAFDMTETGTAQWVALRSALSNLDAARAGQADKSVPDRPAGGGA